MKASIQDQRQVLYILMSLQVPPEEYVRGCDLVRKSLDNGIKHPAECIAELVRTKYIHEAQSPAGYVIRRTQK